jgi:hypothetical protein
MRVLDEEIALRGGIGKYFEDLGVGHGAEAKG